MFLHSCNDLSQCPLTARKCEGTTRVDNTVWLNSASNIDAGKTARS